jgi:hypothetical protein
MEKERRKISSVFLESRCQQCVIHIADISIPRSASQEAGSAINTCVRLSAIMHSEGSSHTATHHISGQPANRTQDKGFCFLRMGSQSSLVSGAEYQKEPSALTIGGTTSLTNDARVPRHRRFIYWYSLSWQLYVLVLCCPISNQRHMEKHELSGMPPPTEYEYSIREPKNFQYLDSYARSSCRLRD